MLSLVPNWLATIEGHYHFCPVAYFLEFIIKVETWCYDFSVLAKKYTRTTSDENMYAPYTSSKLRKMHLSPYA